MLNNSVKLCVISEHTVEDLKYKQSESCFEESNAPSNLMNNSKARCSVNSNISPQPSWVVLYDVILMSKSRMYKKT